MKISEPKQRPLSAYVEDAPDIDASNAITIVDAPPAAPSPPTAGHSQPPQPTQPINVFDFLVNSETPKATPNASKVSLGGLDQSTRKGKHIPKEFADEHLHGHQEKDMGAQDKGSYEERGYSYGEDPVPLKEDLPIVEYITPAPKQRQKVTKDLAHDTQESQRKSSDKKRKRVHVEELDLTAARRPSQEPEIVMADAPPAILHSGLTGGLNRLLSKPNYPPSPEYSNGDPSPPSPAKRSKRSVKEKAEGLSRGRNGALVKVRKRRSSDESRPRKHHRSHHSLEHHSERTKQQKAIEDRPKRKAIEYTPQNHRASDSQHQQQLVVYKSRAELFVSFVTKGPESEQGYSVHKALKRYHRERGELGLGGLGKGDEEKELFRNLRLKRNDRGEVVVFF